MDLATTNANCPHTENIGVYRSCSFCFSVCTFQRETNTKRSIFKNHKSQIKDLLDVRIKKYLICLFQGGRQKKTDQETFRNQNFQYFLATCGPIRLLSNFKGLSAVVTFGKKTHTKYFKSCDKIRRAEEMQQVFLNCKLTLSY